MDLFTYAFLKNKLSRIGSFDYVVFPFDQTKSYEAGNCVMYDGKCYQFTTAHSAGAWTGSDVVEIVVADEIQRLKNIINTLTFTINANGELICSYDEEGGD